MSGRSLRRETRAAVGLLVESARPDARVLGGAVLGLVCAALLEAAGPILARMFIDDVLLPRHAEGLTIAALLAGAMIAGSLASVLRYIQLARLAGLAMRSVQRLRERVFSHVMRLPIGFFDHAASGRLVSRVTNDTEAVKGLYVQVLFVMLDSLVILAGALAAMAWLDPGLMAVVAILIPAVGLIVFAYQRFSAPAVARTRALRGDINAAMAESTAGMAVLQASNATGRFATRYEALNADHLASRRVELRANAWLLRPALDFLAVCLLAAIVGVFGLREFGGALSTVEVGILYAFIGWLARVVEPLIQFTMQFALLQQSVIAASRVRALLGLEPAIAGAGDGTGNGREEGAGDGSIVVDSLRFAYPGGPEVLHGIDFAVAPGEFVGIVGHTGSGKSTLLALLLRFHQPSAGELRIGGLALERLDEAAFRREVAVVPQEPFLLAGSVRENIDMGRGIGPERIEAALADAQADRFVAALDGGLDAPLGEAGSRLSTGQKQLLSIARALAGAPRVLLLDEATAHVDSDTERAVQRAILGLRGRVTVIAIAHRLSTIQAADRILVLDHGRLAETGDHDSLMRIEAGIYRRLVELQRIEARTTASEPQP
ncbi:MAG: ATP-binding cassette domain-containing protein [Pseudomonadota bacterium]|nr:ATP-binding cassette domain-containing protein [Pseudomonadota bacterium]